MKSDDLIQKFNDSRDIHKGYTERAAPLLGMSKQSLDRALYRARQAGKVVAFSTGGTSYSRTRRGEL